MKLKFKNLLSLIIVVFCVILFGGCASIDYSRGVYPEGKIVDRIVVEIDNSAFKYCMFSKTDMLTIIKVDFENYYIQPIEDFKTEFWASNHTFSEKQKVQDGIITDVRIVNDTVFCEVTYSSQEIFDLYYAQTSSSSESQDNDGSNVELREGVFVDKYVQSTNNAYAVLKTEFLQNLIKKYKGYFKNNYGLANLKLTQEYASPDTTINSNATETEIVDGIMKMHYWEIDPNNLDFELEFYTVSPHTTSWYIVALVLSLLSILIVVTILYKRKRANKQ